MCQRSGVTCGNREPAFCVKLSMVAVAFENRFNAPVLGQQMQMVYRMNPPLELYSIQALKENSSSLLQVRLIGLTPWLESFCAGTAYRRYGESRETRALPAERRRMIMRGRCK